jgi:Domain of unknown function DUF29
MSMGAVKEPALKSLYEDDFYGWTTDTAKALKRRDFKSIDMVNLIEEIESMGRSEARELESRLGVLLMHLLKWEYQWLMRSKSWINTIDVQRARTQRVLDKNPSLRPRLPEIIEEAYDWARLKAEEETGMPIKTFPATCAYPAEQLFSEGWLPTARE